MKLHKNKVTTRMLFAVTFLFACFFLRNTTIQSAEFEQSKVFATITVASEDAVWKAAERLGSEMKFLETVQGVRTLVDSNLQDYSFVSAYKPFGFALTTNGNEIVPFGFIPLKNTELNEESLNALKERISSKLQGTSPELVVKDSTLLVTLPKFKKLLPSQIDSLGKINVSKKQNTILEVNVDFTFIPQEFIDAALASFRQKVVKQISEEEELENLELLWEYYSSIVSSISHFQSALIVDEDNNFVVQTAINCKEGSVLGQQLLEMSNAKTRWSGLPDKSNVIFKTVAAGKIPDSLKKYEVNQLKKIASKNLLNQLDVLLDDPTDFDTAKQLVNILIEEETATLENGIFDTGIALNANPLVLALGGNVAKPKLLQQSLQIIAERLRKDIDLDQYLSLNAEEHEGFSISKIEVPITQFTKEPIAYFSNKSLVVRLGFNKDSFALALGLDASEVDQAFDKLLKGTAHPIKVPKQSVFNVAPLAKVLYDVLSNTKNVNPVALKTLESIAEAENLKLISNNSFENNVIKYELQIESELFKKAGEVIRINLAKGNIEDTSEDMDSVFDEE